MNAITMMQNAILAKLKGLFGDPRDRGVLREIDILAGRWDQDTARRITKATPAVYVTWLGADASKVQGQLNHHWVLWIVARVLNGRSDEINAHDIIERIHWHFNDVKLHNDHGAIGGTLQHRKTENLWTDGQSGAGVHIFAMTFDQLMTPISDIAAGDLNEFLSLYHTWQTENQTLMNADIHPREPNGLPKQN